MRMRDTGSFNYRDSVSVLVCDCRDRSCGQCVFRPCNAAAVGQPGTPLFTFERMLPTESEQLMRSVA